MRLLLFSRILSHIEALLYGMHCLNILESAIIYIRYKKALGAHVMT